MALIKSVLKDEKRFRSVHPTEVDCRYVVGECDGRKVLQLNTYGSMKREMTDKLSQTMQFDEASARMLWTVLGREFSLER